MTKPRLAAIAFGSAAVWSCLVVWPLATAALAVMALGCLAAPDVMSLVRRKRTPDPSDFAGADRP